jgi:hypothetical protein
MVRNSCESFREFANSTNLIYPEGGGIVVGPAVLCEPPLLLVRLGEELLHLLLQVHEAPGQPVKIGQPSE